MIRSRGWNVYKHHASRPQLWYTSALLPPPVRNGILTKKWSTHPQSTVIWRQVFQPLNFCGSTLLSPSPRFGAHSPEKCVTPYTSRADTNKASSPLVASNTPSPASLRSLELARSSPVPQTQIRRSTTRPGSLPSKSRQHPISPSRLSMHDLHTAVPSRDQRRGC